MRKFVLTIVLCFTVVLCACGKNEEVKKVEDLISNIGTVSFSSSENIQAALDAYNALSNDDKKKVDNFQILEDAQKAYDDLGIQITLDNYSKYLNVSVNTTMEDGMDLGLYVGLGKTVGSTIFRSIKGSVSISGKSSNYDYNDITATVIFTGDYLPVKTGIDLDEAYLKEHLTEIDFELTAVTDIVGNGYADNKIDMPDGYYLPSSGNFVNIDYEIVDVSGTMTPVK